VSERITSVRGRSWVFWRIPLPHEGERDGNWHFLVDRVPTGGEFPPEPTDVRYQYLVISAGGPKLVPLVQKRRYYTGDVFDPLVGLHYPNRTFPADAHAVLFVERPDVALGQLVSNAGLRPPQVSGDTLGGFHATLQHIASSAGGKLPIPISKLHVTLFDDGFHDDGAMEPDGIFNHRLTDLLRVEGTYQFRAVASYGGGCKSTREAHWSLHVEPGIDPGRSDVTVEGAVDGPGGLQGTLVITPRDRYGNPIGPGRGGLFTVTPMPGVTVVGPVRDRGDGSYDVPVRWDPAVTPQPGVMVQQPDRPSILIAPTPEGSVPCPPRDCRRAADALLDCLGLPCIDAKSVRVTKVCVEVDVEAPAVKPDGGCKDANSTQKDRPKGTC
jgi:hypothetical protein